MCKMRVYAATIGLFAAGAKPRPAVRDARQGPSMCRQLDGKLNVYQEVFSVSFLSRPALLESKGKAHCRCYGSAGAELDAKSLECGGRDDLRYGHLLLRRRPSASPGDAPKNQCLQLPPKEQERKELAWTVSEVYGFFETLPRVLGE
jgi:hypothetical protein